MSQILPPNSTPVEHAIDDAFAERIAGLRVIIGSLWNAATCPLEWLGLLAWSLSVDNWRPEWSETVKRAVIAASPRVHRLKGTVAAVEAAIEPFGHAAIREWFEDPSGEMAPHTFAVTLLPRPGGAAPVTAIEDMIAAIKGAKPLRSHFTVQQGVQLTGPLTIAGVLRVATFSRVSPTGAV